MGRLLRRFIVRLLSPHGRYTATEYTAEISREEWITAYARGYSDANPNWHEDIYDERAREIAARVYDLDHAPKTWDKPAPIGDLGRKR